MKPHPHRNKKKEQSRLKASAPSWKPPSAPNNNAGATPSAPAPMAWGSKTSSAVREAPPPLPPQQTKTSGFAQDGGRNNNNNNSGWRGGKHHNNHQKGGRGGGRNNRGNRNRDGKGRHDNRNNRNDNNNDGWTRGKTLPVELLKPNEGNTPSEKAVIRVTIEDLLGLRLSFLDPPASWANDQESKSEEGEDVSCPRPPDNVVWNTETRVADIESTHKAGRVGGDLAPRQRKNKEKKDNETAPPLEECAPLQVNEETRWKARVFKKDEAAEEAGAPTDDETDDEVLKKALLVLNKLSLTKFDKLSDAFIETGIGRNEECLKQAISLVVEKAQSEPHFSNMYALLCVKLGSTPMKALDEEGTKKGKKFKKLLLNSCQREFEEDTAHKIARVTESIEDPEEKEYQANIIKKNYLGHMRFIGELYKGDLIRINIMLFCLYDLLGMPTTEFVTKDSEEETEETKDDKEEIDEEKIECFAKLMTTIGLSLEEQAKASKKPDYLRQLGECWNTVEIMAGARKSDKTIKVSNRVKFMLQDLIEMRDKGWVTRRKEETAKTIEQIHKEVAKEERKARRPNSSGNLKKMGSSGNLRRMGSSGNLKSMNRSNSKPMVDADGFVTVGGSGGGKSAGMKRTNSSGSLRRNYSGSSGNWNTSGEGNSGGKMKRNTSQGSFSGYREDNASKQKKNYSKSSSDLSVDKPTPSKPPLKPKTYKSPADCKKSFKNLLKEYIVGGDTDDAVLSLYELIGDESEDGAMDRGVAAIESGCGFILEQKPDDVQKFILLISRCFSEKKLPASMVTKGISDLLEFLGDIVIDAPLAGSHMTKVIVAFMKIGIFKLDFMLSTPEYFKTDGDAARFAIKVMMEYGDVESEENIAVVSGLMTEEEKKTFSTAQDLIQSVIS